MRFWKVFLYCLFLIYPGISSTVFRHFICKDVETKRYILSDLRVECDTDIYNRYAIGTFPFILLYPIGIPSFFYALLRTNLVRLKEPRILAQLGFLYAGYNLNHWWFEIVDSFHKVLVTSLLGFLPRDAQLPCGMAVVGTYMITLLVINPYLRPSDDRLHQLALCELLLLLMVGYIFRSLPLGSFSETDDIVISIALLAVTFGFIFFFVYFCAKGVYAIAN